MTDNPLPCPFCGHDNIRVYEDEKPKQPLKGSKYTYAHCAVCGTRGPWAYNVDDDEKESYRKCVIRWNERQG